jgi:hypothetical protein
MLLPSAAAGKERPRRGQRTTVASPGRIGHSRPGSRGAEATSADAPCPRFLAKPRELKQARGVAQERSCPLGAGQSDPRDQPAVGVVNVASGTDFGTSNTGKKILDVLPWRSGARRMGPYLRHPFQR